MEINKLTSLLKLKYSPQLLIFTMISFFFGFIAFSIFYGEHILAGNGLGWDGFRYSKYAQNFYEVIFNHQLSAYVSQRIFPLFLIYITTQILHFTITEANSVFLFSMLNVSLLILSVLIWSKLAKKLQWNLGVQIISFSGLFLNFVNLKMAFYYPTLTDTTAFTLGLLILYFYVNGGKKCLLLTTVIGAFTYPTLLYAGLVLFLFPMNNKISITAETTTKKLNLLLAIVQSVVITTLSVVIWHQHDWLGAARALGSDYSLPVLGLSTIALFLYLTAGLYPMSSYYRSILVNFKNLFSFKRIVISGLVYVFVKLSIKWISSPDITSGLTIWEYIIHIAGQALAYPFVFIISHVIYFGPIVCLLIFLWKDALRHLIKERAIGLFFLTGIYILLSIGSESRQLVNFLPIAVYMVAEVLNRKILSSHFILAFTLISLFISKFWFPINHGVEWPSLLTNPPEMTLQFPLQWFFMNHGPWISHQMFVINAIIVSGSFLAVFLIMRTRSSNSLQHPDTVCSEKMVSY